jgi:choice-of-anchor B domain-containing protein
MLFTLGLSQGIQAHAEHDKARFVAPNGVDNGSCNNRFRPCQTVSYAAQQAAKGDKILVAQGQYQITSEQDLLYFSGAIIPVLGGFDTVDQYQNQNPDTFVTSLIGVPSDFIAQLSQQGFHVIRDTKSLAQLELLGKNARFNSVTMMQESQQAANCIDGNAAGFACQNISLLAHMPRSQFPSSPSSANDIWGHFDLNTGKEYAIIGLNNGISVVDVSEPETPLIIGTINGQSTSWRDIKVLQYFDVDGNRWRAYAYATADNVSEGVTIIDLSGLPDSIALVQKQTIDASAHNVYISNVDYGLNIALPNAEPLLHITGSNRSNGSFRSYSLLNPESLSLRYQPVVSFSTDYTHDASSLLIDDSRAQNECVNATVAGCNVLLDFNESTMRLWDHSKQDEVVALSDTGYPMAEYTHSGWWTEDKQYVLVHDELDERSYGINTTINIFDISSLKHPVLVGTWRGPTLAIDHNGFVRGNHYFMSNYERGLTVLDISQAASPQQIGFFDTYPVSNNATFNGAWGVYPFLPSGNILVSDINSGLFVLRDDTAHSNAEQITFNATQLTVIEGDSVLIEINKAGSNSATVGYQILSGSANDTDYETSQGELTWAANDNSSNSISIPITMDNIEEPDELFFVRLFNPQNGAALGYPNLLQITIQGTPQSGKISLSQSELSVKETDGTVILKVERLGGNNGLLRINYLVQSDSAIVGQDVEDSHGILEWQDGETSSKTITLSLINDNDSEANESFLLTLQADDERHLGSQSSTRITLFDDESNQAPIVNASENRQVNTRQNTQLLGSSSDPEGRELTYQWQQLAGSSVSLSNANTLQVTFVAPSTAGTLEFSLSVTDDFGLTSSDNVQIFVVAPPPSVNTGTGGGGGSTGAFGILFLTLCWYLRTKSFKIDLANSKTQKLHTK